MPTYDAVDMHLKVHIDLDHHGKTVNDKSIDFALTGQPILVLTIYVDGSTHADMIGFAAVWKDPTAPVAEHWVHDKDSRIVPIQNNQQNVGDEAELSAIKLGLSNSLLWRPAGVDTVYVMSDSRRMLDRTRKWVEGADPAATSRYEPILTQMKHLAERLHGQGVAVTLRWLKSRSFIDGHDIADIWARMACGADPDITGQYHQRHHEMRRLVSDQIKWERENEDPRLADELAALERET